MAHVVAIAAGGDHTLALRNDGTVWAWGNSLYGELGTSTPVNSATPVDPSSTVKGTYEADSGLL